jgi:hypothetical protein
MNRRENDDLGVSRAPYRLLLIGQFTPEHVGHHLLNGAKALGIEVSCLDVNAAFSGPAWASRFSWHLFGHRPPRLQTFGRAVASLCDSLRPTWILATGLAPLNASTLDTVGSLGITRINFLTDDPWNSAHRAPWFLRALNRYDYVFSPRHANIEDLCSIGCPHVTYLPFAYDPLTHFPEQPMTDDERQRMAYDVLFVGGADEDRIPWLHALKNSGFDIGLYGGYWDRYRETRPLARGLLPPEQVRRAASASKVSVALVRKANRDGHAMRSYELPAMAACFVAEDTPDHRRLYGEEGDAVLYFATPSELVVKTRWLLDHDLERTRMASKAHATVVSGSNTYQDRLATMLSLRGAEG